MFSTVRTTAMLLSTIIAMLFGQMSAFAAIQSYTFAGDRNLSDNLNVILIELNQQSGLKLTPEHFTLVEERDLATSHFKTYAQIVNGIPVKGALIRTWSNIPSRIVIHAEATIDNGALNAMRTKILNQNGLPHRALRTHLSRLDNMKFIRQIVLNHRDDRKIGQIKWSDEWSDTSLNRIIEIKGKRGTHRIVVSHFTKKVIAASYSEFPQVELQANVYPIYEETEKHVAQNRIRAALTHILPQRRATNGDPYLPLRSQRYLENMIDDVRGSTPEGRAEGYWSPNLLLSTAKALFAALPQIPNVFENYLYLDGEFATINLHPDAVSQIKGIEFNPESSGQLSLIWKPVIVNNEETYELIPTSAYHGRPLLSQNDALIRPARRLPDHNVATYINDGFDDVQVYYAINKLMLSLHAMGFNDPELSTRPFHAFLYDPDISMRDNAYYVDDTINFTTYSPESQNYARDNSTIWHELGHGVMDRLMGSAQLSGNGGLAEGMADFIAQLVVHDVTNSTPFDGSDSFRIVNQTSFDMTNESHDDGEAYGGAMNDMLLKAIAQWGRNGLIKITDLTLEAMRLARNHPGLTANAWFERMLLADSLGREGIRAPGELAAFINTALQSRNFRMDKGPVAKFTIKNGNEELTSSSPGSRYNAIPVTLKPDQEQQYTLTMQATPSEFFQFKYPLKIKVGLNGGPLEGAIKWKNENLAPFELTLNGPKDMAQVTLTAQPGCDFVNREDGSCSDYAYIQVYNNGDALPFAKKRFYLRVTTVPSWH